MKNGYLLLGLATFCVLAAIHPASAQFFPSVGYGGWGGWNGSAALAGSDYLRATGMELTAQSRQLTQQAAMQQNLVVHNTIQNTLSTEAQSRASAIASQRQADRDWWFQTQQQKFAGQGTRPASAPVAVAAGFGPAPTSGGFAPADPTPPASTDIIKWPSVLQERPFASRRTLIEKPYRQSPPGLSVPTADDYRNMVKTISEMKAILEWRLSQGGLITEDYEQAKAFLDKIGQEASQRSGGGSPAVTKQ